MDWGTTRRRRVLGPGSILRLSPTTRVSIGPSFPLSTRTAASPGSPSPRRTFLPAVALSRKSTETKILLPSSGTGRLRPATAHVAPSHDAVPIGKSSGPPPSKVPLLPSPHTSTFSMSCPGRASPRFEKRMLLRMSGSYPLAGRVTSKARCRWEPAFAMVAGSG